MAVKKTKEQKTIEVDRKEFTRETGNQTHVTGGREEKERTLNTAGNRPHEGPIAREGKATQDKRS